MEHVCRHPSVCNGLGAQTQFKRRGLHNLIHLRIAVDSICCWGVYVRIHYNTVMENILGMAHTLMAEAESAGDSATVQNISMFLAFLKYSDVPECRRKLLADLQVQRADLVFLFTNFILAAGITARCAAKNRIRYARHGQISHRRPH